MVLYFINNTFNCTVLDRTIDFYVPISITRLYDKDIRFIPQNYPSALLQSISDTQYIRFVDQGLLEIQIDYLTKQLIALTVVSSKKITIHHCLWQTSLPVLERAIAVTSSQLTYHYDTYTPYDIYKDCTLELYPNALQIMLPQGGSPCYFVCEKDTLGVITDRDFIIKSFVVLNLQKQELSTLLEYTKGSNTFILQDCNNNSKTGSLFMNNTQVLIDKLFEFQNIDTWQVLYYGLHRFLVDTEFCVKYAEAYLARFDNVPALIVELAGLALHEYNQVYSIFDKLVGDKDIIMNNKAQVFNKIWCYLQLAIDMHISRFIP